jgi:beta-mannosidase
LVDYLTLPATPILTEFGAQALPDEASLREMVGETWPPDWDRMAYYDFQYDQTFHVANVPLGNSWTEFVENSQTYQARLLKFAIEHYRQAKYTALGGLFQFMFMDCWPSITWSVVSYARVPKKGYFTLQQCFQPVLIGINLSRERMILGTDRGSHTRVFQIMPWIVNDRHEALIGCSYSLRISGPGGSFDFSSPEVFDFPEDGVLKEAPRLICNLPEDLAPGQYGLDLELHGQNTTLSSNRYEITVKSIPR